MFTFPTLMLFVFLIFETAKVSREKIRHQFAIDAAAFVEMTNYSDFLNRSAYVNGAFPMRIFKEGFGGVQLDNLGRSNNTQYDMLDNILYNDGAFPRDPLNPARQEFGESDRVWTIAFGGKRSGMNSDNPTIATPDCVQTGSQTRGQSGAVTGDDIDNCFTLISLETARLWNLNWEDANAVYKLYVQIYQLLGSVESAQYNVLKRLATRHNFLQKSYYLNLGTQEALNEGSQAVNSFDRYARNFADLGRGVKFHCAQYIMFHGVQVVRAFGQPYQIWASDPIPKMPDTMGECRGLFQLVTVDRNILRGMATKQHGDYPGWPVEVRYAVPAKNYFNVDLNAMMTGVDGGPKVHATVSAAGFGATAAVWPNPTPKFQVRLYP